MTTHLSLYNKYRPMSFGDLIGQDLISTILINSITNQHTVQSYIFSGPRGTGKTTTARLFAKALNCLQFKKDVCNQCVNCVGINEKTTTNILEIDAASNNGIDHIRELISNASYLPVDDYMKKVYIIDEAHMLTTNAWNGLLKIVEEPPAHIVIIFSTTEFDKIIPTIRSRCQKHHFSLLDLAHLTKHLISVAKQEKYTLEKDAAHKLAALSYGSVRDSLTLLDQMMLYCKKKISYEDVIKILQLVDNATKIELLTKLFVNDTVAVLELIEQLYYRGVSLMSLVHDLIEIMLDLLVYQETKSPKFSQTLNYDELQNFSKIPNNLFEHINTLNKLMTDLKQAKNPLLLFKIAMVQLGHAKVSVSSVSAHTPQTITPNSTSTTINNVVADNVSVPLDESVDEMIASINSESVETKIDAITTPIDPQLPYVHDSNLFSTKCVFISDKDLLEAVQTKADKVKKLTSSIKTKTTKATSNNSAVQVGFDLEDNLINYTLKHRNKTNTQDLLVKIKELLNSEHALKTYFVKTDQTKKFPILVSDNTVLVMFNDLNDAYDFNEALEDKSILVQLNEYFNTAMYWVASTFKAIAFRKDKLEQFSIIDVPSFDMKQYQKGSVIKTIMETLKIDS